MIRCLSLRRGRMTLACGAALFLIAGIPAAAQNAPIAPPNSLGRDTVYVAIPDTVTRVTSVDPLRPYFPSITPFGSIIPAAELAANRVVTNLDLASSRYATAYDVLEPNLPAYPLSEGAPGLARFFSYAGSAPASIAWLYDGRPLEAPIGGFDQELYPMEFLERIEIAQGARALLYGTGEALLTINFVQPRFDVEASYVRAWYLQDAGDFTAADLMYARNIGRRTNFTLGFRRLTTAGDQSVRYQNQQVSTWSIHGNATWRPARGLMVSLTDLYYDGTRGENGGLPEGEPTDPRAAAVNYTLLNERQIRHDITLGAEWIDPRGWVDPADSATAASTAGTIEERARASASLYYTGARRQVQEGDSIVVLDGVLQQWLGDRVGARAAVQIPFPFLRLEATGLAELALDKVATDGTNRLQAGAMAELPLGSSVRLRGSGRYSSGREGEIAGTAAEVQLDAGPISARAGGRWLTRRCPCEVPATVQSFELYATTAMIEAFLMWRGPEHFLEVGAALRRAEPVFTVPDAEQSFLQLEARAHVPIALLRLDVHLVGSRTAEASFGFPTVRGTGDLYAPLRLFEGNLDLRAGTTVEYHSPLSGPRYDPFGGQLQQLTSGGPSQSQYPDWSVYAQARVGTAFVRAAVRNILDVRSWSLYRQPIQGRSLLLEVTWSLID